MLAFVQYQMILLVEGFAARRTNMSLQHASSVRMPSPVLLKTVFPHETLATMLAYELLLLNLGRHGFVFFRLHDRMMHHTGVRHVSVLYVGRQGANVVDQRRIAVVEFFV